MFCKIYHVLKYSENDLKLKYLNFNTEMGSLDMKLAAYHFLLTHIKRINFILKKCIYYSLQVLNFHETMSL